MENASKALIMAAGVLIGLMVLALFVYLFSSFGASTAQMGDQIRQNQLNQFNSQFTSYEGKDDLTIYDVVTVANLATENNKYYNYPLRKEDNINDSYVSVIFNGEHIEGKTDYGTYIDKDVENVSEDTFLTTYNCKVQISPVTGRVYKVTFE